MAIKYKWLAERLKEMIYSDIEKGIEKLPTEQELCERFRVSPSDCTAVSFSPGRGRSDCKKAGKRLFYYRPSHRAGK